MLILSRRQNEEIWIDQGRIKLRINHIGLNSVKIGLEAPRNIDIRRKELMFKKKINALKKCI